MRICYININDYNNEQWEKIKDNLPWEERKIKADKYRFKEDRYRCIGAGALLYKMLQDTGIGDYTMAKGKDDKPYLINSEDVHFNISHSNDYAICALDCMPVGIDIEQRKDANIKVAKRFFTKKEYEWIIDNDSDIRFNRIWTLKESYVKYKGVGIKLPFNEFEVMPEFGKLPEGASFYEYEIGDYHVAVCTASDNQPKLEKIKLI